MAIVLTNGTYYLAHSTTGAIIKVSDIRQAQDFHTIDRAIIQKNKAPRITKGYYYIDTSVINEKSNRFTISYVITDGSNYIGYDKIKGKNIIVQDYKDCVKLKYAKANRILASLDSSMLKSADWKIISTIEAEEDLSKAINFDINCIVDSLEVDFNLLIKRKKVLELEYLQIEREITDIYHAMEFYNLNAAKGYKMYHMMHERLIRRRKNKNESLKIDYILSGGIKGLTNDSTRRKIEELDHRNYQPRVLKELFNM